MKPFAADFGMHGVVLTGAKHRLMAALVNGTQRIPSHLVNKFWVRPFIYAALRAARVPEKKARTLSQRYADFMDKSVDAQCDALVVAPFGKKLERAVQAALREDVIVGLPSLISDVIDAVEEARSR